MDTFLLRRILWIAPSLILSLSSSCVSPQICQKDAAYHSGKETALAGRSPDFSVGQACEDQTQAEFRASYQLGHDEGVKALCQPQVAAAEGREQGSFGQTLGSLPQRFLICGPELSSLEKSFRAAHAVGIREFCQPATVRQVAQDQAAKAQPADFSLAQYKVCGTAAGKELEAVYNRAYKDTLDNFCQGAEIEDLAYNQGLSNSIGSALPNRYQICPQAKRVQLQERFRLAERRGLREYCEPKNHSESIRQSAAAQRRATVPENYRSCLANFPELWDAYETQFVFERDALVRSQCTYEQGARNGSLDAGQRQNREGGIPVFCSESAGSDYLRGYATAWDEAKRQICRADEAMDKGYQDGIRALSVQIRYPKLCPQAYHAEYELRYLKGYRRGQEQSTARQDPKDRVTVGVCYPIYGHNQNRQPQLMRIKSQKFSVDDGSWFWPNGQIFLKRNASFADDRSLFYPNGQILRKSNAGFADDGSLFWPNGTVLLKKNRGYQDEGSLFLADQKAWLTRHPGYQDDRQVHGPDYVEQVFGNTSVAYRIQKQTEDQLTITVSSPSDSIIVELNPATGKFLVRECQGKSKFK